MRFRLFHLQSFHEPAVLLRREQPYLSLIPRPLVDAALQALVQQNESILFPIQSLDPIPAPSAEKKQCIREGVQIEFLLHHSGQTVDAFSQICVAACKVHTVGPGEVI